MAALCDLFFYFDWLSIVVDAKHLSLVMNTACFQVNKEFTTSCEGKITPLTIALFIKLTVSVSDNKKIENRKLSSRA